MKHVVQKKQPGWIGIDIQNTRQWITESYSGHIFINLTVNIQCRNCLLHKEKRKLPFLKVTKKNKIFNRQRRSVACTNESKTCCLNNFQVNFQEIGWDKWILAPSGYNAKQCQGSCHKVTLTDADYGSVRRAVVKQKEHNEHPKPCCTPQTYLPLSILHMDDEGNVVREDIKDLIVSRCGCGMWIFLKKLFQL